MTKARSTPFAARLSYAPAALLLASQLLALAHAQGLKPSTELRAPGAPTFGTQPNPPRAPALSRPANTPAPSSAVQQADFIVAVVNSEPLTNSEVRRKLLRAEQQLSAQGAEMPPRDQLRRQVLERMISDRIQLQTAKTFGYKIEETALETAEANVARENQISISDLRRRLSEDGVVYSQFRNELRDELLVNRLRTREVEARVSITEGDVDQFLREQEGAASVGALELNLAQILVPVPENASAAQIATLQAKAQQAFDKAKAGEDFVGLYNSFSVPGSSANGGEIGLRSADRLPALFVEATQSLRVGGVAGPLRSGAGFHVLKVLEKKQAGQPGFAITQTRARHVLLRVTPQLTQAQALQKLADLRQKIGAGQLDFAVAAKDNSEDGSAASGGDLGWASPGMFVPEFEQVMNSLAAAQVSAPFVSRFGVHLMQVLERRETQLSTKEQRDLAKAALREKKQDEAYALWAAEVRGRAYVEYRDPPQ